MKIRRKPSRLPSPAYFKLKRLMAERRQYVKQSMLYKQQLPQLESIELVLRFVLLLQVEIPKLQRPQ